MRRLGSMCVVLCTLTLFALPARAVLISDFSLIGPGLVINFSLPTSPTPDLPFISRFVMASVPMIVNGVDEAHDVSFWVAPNGGVSVFGVGDWTGQQLFSGTTNVPTFIAGQFALLNGEVTYTLDITEGENIPESTSLALLVAGLVGLTILRIRKET